jgi:cytidylate kinase
MLSHPVIAIDGPAASGKSSVARALANRIGFTFVSSGLLYRAVTWLALRENHEEPRPGHDLVALLQEEALVCRLEQAAMVLQSGGVILDEEELAVPLVNRHVSACSAIPGVRQWTLAQFRRFADEAPLVMEGRDIGSVVFPETPFKFYLDADPAVREQRRRAQGIGDAIAVRDRMDSTRATAPLAVADGATVINNSHLDLAETVEAVMKELSRRGFEGFVS